MRTQDARFALPESFVNPELPLVFLGASRSAGTVLFATEARAGGFDATTGALRWSVEFAPFVVPFKQFRVTHAQLAETGGEPLLFVRGGKGVFETERRDVAFRAVDGSIVWESTARKDSSNVFSWAGDCGSNRVAGLSVNGTLDVFDLRTRQQTSRRFRDLEPHLKESPDDLSIFGKPLLRAHPAGVLLLRAFYRPILTGFACAL